MEEQRFIGVGGGRRMMEEVEEKKGRGREKGRPRREEEETDGGGEGRIAEERPRSPRRTSPALPQRRQQHHSLHSLTHSFTRSVSQSIAAAAAGDALIYCLLSPKPSPSPMPFIDSVVPRNLWSANCVRPTHHSRQLINNHTPTMRSQLIELAASAAGRECQLMAADRGRVKQIARKGEAPHRWVIVKVIYVQACEAQIKQKILKNTVIENNFSRTFIRCWQQSNDRIPPPISRNSSSCSLPLLLKSPNPAGQFLPLPPFSFPPPFPTLFFVSSSPDFSPFA
jgi:hypothetical protein